MGSNFFGGDHRLSSSSSNSSQSSSRKGKKNGGSDKPKQPQRGLGVAQLEKIRLHSQLGCNYLPSVPNPYHAAAPNLSQEDMRLQGAYPAPPSSSFSYSSSSPYAVHGTQAVMMGFQDLDRGNIRYVDSQTTNVARWHPPGNAAFGSQQSAEPGITRSFFEPRVDQGSFNNKTHWLDSRGSGSQNSEANTEIDLELRL